MTTLNVRELLELERNLYQESIDRNGRQHDALLNGTLEDYVLKCLPFEQDRERELEAASVHLQLNKRNAADLLDVEIKQADDMYKIGEKDKFRVADHVILWSSISEEEFYGQVDRISPDSVELLLLCGSRIVVRLEMLRKRHRRKHTLGPLQKF
ncbi:hypothetical protein P43SY_005620 [Pythium insidiosum]|uniref:Uncharacterized protein n=1 Tax=Pythium insidiosum TaxID=114742 RepID=A0AAD5LBR9_PYTIN|nr:hypothetical protein P43SY_005620 [Pythium insidiosum]KAJ0395157.1 hypothetical protein ATCC90586_007454 [Pythium insidiosum]